MHHHDCENHHHEHESSKYESALALYETHLSDEAVRQETERIIATNLPQNDTRQAKEFLLSCLDLTSLHTEDTEESTLRLIERINRFNDEFEDLEHVAAVCLYPSMIHLASQSLEADDVAIAAVSAGFPHSQTFPEVKMAETALCLKDGATEIDIVLNVGKFLSGDYEAVCDEIEEQKALCGEKPLKVILETGALRTARQIKRAAILALYAGADFIKTSTGKQQPAATPEAALVMCSTLREYYEKTGRKAGFKAAGGLNSVRDALTYYTIVKEVLGEEWLSPAYFRLGTSRLANLLLSDITGTETHYF